MKLGFKNYTNSPCVYSKLKGDTKLIVAIYIDDSLLLSNNNEEKNKLKKQLALEFNIKDLGKVKSILGIRVRREKNKIYLDQKSYIEVILRKFNISNCVPVSIRIGSKIKKSNHG